MSVRLTACHRANSDFPSRGRKILIGPFSSRAGRILYRPWNLMMRQLHDENGTKSLNWPHGYRADCTMQSQTQSLDRTTARKPWSIERLHRSRDWSKNRIKPEPRYQHVTVTESKQSTVVKLEPSAGPTLFLIRTTTDRSTTATAIRI